LPVFAFAHSLLGDVMWNQLTAACCPGGVMSACNFHNPTSMTCINQLNNVGNFIYGDNINIYDIYLPCDFNNMVSNNAKPRMRDPRAEYIWERMMKRISPQLHNNLVAHRKYGTEVSNNFGLNPPCIDVYAASTWLNTPAVRTALHIPSNLPAWEICSDVVNGGYTSVTPESVSLFPGLLKNYRILVYNGDVDMACNFLGDEWAVDSLNLTLLEPYRTWHQGEQVAGFINRFQSLVFLTVRGAGHMVPQWKPEQAYTMFLNFIADSNYP